MNELSHYSKLPYTKMVGKRKVLTLQIGGFLLVHLYNDVYTSYMEAKLFMCKFTRPIFAL